MPKPKKPKAKPTDKPKDTRTASQCGADSFAALRKVFAARHNLSDEQAREADKAFRGVSKRLNELEEGK